MNLTHEQALDLAAGYVLGALDPEEEQAVREHLASCDLSHEEFAQLGGVVPYLAEGVEQVEPAAPLRQRVLAAAAADLGARRAAGRQLTEPVPFPSAAEREAPRPRTSRGEWLLRVAAVLVIVALGAWNLLLQGQLNAAQDYQQSVAAVLDLAAQPGSQTAIVRGDGPRGIAAVGADGSVRIAMRNLSPTSGSEVYEAWVIAPGGAAPVPIGGFTIGPSGVGGVTSPGAGPAQNATIALTREPRPNPTAPTLPIIASGIATAPPSG